MPGSCERGCTLTPNTVELIPTLGAFFPRGGQLQDPVLTEVPLYPSLQTLLLRTGKGRQQRGLGQWLQCQANGSNVCRVLGGLPHGLPRRGTWVPRS